MRRIDKYKMLTEWRKDMRLERQFETNLAIEAEKDGLELDPVFRDNEWGTLFQIIFYRKPWLNYILFR